MTTYKLVSVKKLIFLSPIPPITIYKKHAMSGQYNFYPFAMLIDNLDTKVYVSISSYELGKSKIGRYL